MLVASSALAALGCKGSLPPIATDTKLGRVIIYRNGVAYFERYAEPGEEKLTMRVPGERVDDFLKSLTIVDEKTGEAMPVSYPTHDPSGGEVDMVIPLPAGHGRLRISYVTESPAWKPSYRIVLSDEKPAKIQGWAIVDNITTEDWENVRVGVGSTSALSFRYDLHSVLLVQRETLSSGSLLAVAPPTGGSPYAVATKKVKVLGNISAADLVALGHSGGGGGGGKLEKEAGRRIMADMAPPPPPRPADGDSDGVADDEDEEAGDFQTDSRAQRKLPPQTQRPRVGRANLDAWSQQAQAGGNRIRIEGFAQAGDADPRQASLQRANLVRQQLISSGVPAAQIEAVGTGVFNSREAVRVMETDEPVGAPQGEEVDLPPDSAAEAEGQPLGHAHFVALEPMTIKGEHSAMVSILNDETTAERVFFYDPVSSRGSKQYAFNAVRLVNPSRYTLDSGPFTVYAEGQFLGEGLSEPILPGSTAFIPYALDRSIIADPELSTREEIERLLTIQRGIVTTETRSIRKTVLTLTNRGKQDAEVYVRHQVKPGFTLSQQSQRKVEKLGGAHLFPLSVKAGEGVELVIEEWTPIMKTVDIRTDRGVADIALYLRKAKLEPKLKKQLDDIIKSHKATGDLNERIAVLGEQMAVYRARVDEINVQLVTLKKVQQAAKLRSHLSEKMEEISERLQQATMEMTDLKGQLMALRIELQDKLAELTLKRQPDEEPGAGASKPGAGASKPGAGASKPAQDDDDQDHLSHRH